MSLSGTLSSFINGQAQQQLGPFASLLGGKGPNVGLPISVSGSASSSATSGPSKSGDISGGTAFNIGGINLGQQYESPATVSGGNPAATLSGQIAGLSTTTLLIIGAFAIVGLILYKRL